MCLEKFNKHSENSISGFRNTLDLTQRFGPKVSRKVGVEYGNDRFKVCVIRIYSQKGFLF